MEGESGRPLEEALAQRIRRQDYDRLTALSDGVFGFAMTLLALEVKPALGAPPDRLWPSMIAPVLSFVISFAVTATFWLTHKRLFARLHGVDGRLTALTLVLLGEVALLPAGTELLYQHTGAQAQAMYLGLVALIGLTQAAMWAHAALAAKLLHAEVSRRYAVAAVVSNTLLPTASAGVSLWASQSGSLTAIAGAGAAISALLLLRRRLFRPEK